MLKIIKNFTTIRQAEEQSKKILKNGTFQWLNSGAENNLTTKKNLDDFNKIQIYPKILKKVKTIDTSLYFLGKKIPYPLILSPMGHQAQFHKNGEIEMALGIKASNTLGVFSTQSRTSFNEILTKSKNPNLIWQIFPFGDKNWILSEIRKAEQFKSLAISFCFDGLTRSHRYDDRETMYDARNHGYFRYNGAPNQEYAKSYDWDFLKWVKLKTSLPIIPKGLVSIEDIKSVIKFGCKYIWISNHGGRMFNSNISSIDILLKIKKKISRPPFIIVDGGVRKGTDIIKLLCLGANLIGIGRPAIYGLSIQGKKGVKRIFDILHSEITTCMINAGFKNLKDMKFSRIDFT